MSFEGGGWQARGEVPHAECLVPRCRDSAGAVRRHRHAYHAIRVPDQNTGDIGLLLRCRFAHGWTSPIVVESLTGEGYRTFKGLDSYFFLRTVPSKFRKSRFSAGE